MEDEPGCQEKTSTSAISCGISLPAQQWTCYKLVALKLPALVRVDAVRQARGPGDAPRASAVQEGPVT